MIKLLIASSQVLFYQALKHVIHEYNEKIAVEYVESGEHILARSLDTYFDVIIIDVNLDGLSGLDLLRKMNNKSLNSRVLVVSVPPDEFLLKEMIDLDVKGFLCLSADGAEYIKAVDSMIHKGRYVSTELTNKMIVGGVRTLNDNLHDNLSKRESQVMLLIAQGKSIKEIAAQFSLSDKTVSTYKARVFQKMNFENTTQLIKYVLCKKIA